MADFKTSGFKHGKEIGEFHASKGGNVEDIVPYAHNFVKYILDHTKLKYHEANSNNFNRRKMTTFSETHSRMARKAREKLSQKANLKQFVPVTVIDDMFEKHGNQTPLFYRYPNAHDAGNPITTPQDDVWMSPSEHDYTKGVVEGLAAVAKAQTKRR